MLMLWWFIIVIITFFLALVIFKPSENKLMSVFSLNLYHFIFSIIFLNFSSDKVTDSRNYFDWALAGTDFGFFGTGFVVNFVSALNWLGLREYEIVFFIFSALSSLAIISIYLFLSEIIRKSNSHKKLSVFLFFIFLLPGFHFWTVSIGKDVLTILSIAWVVLGIYKGRQKYLLLGIFLALCIRPHVAAFLLLSFYFYQLFYLSWKPEKISNGLYRVALVIISLPIFVGLSSFLLSYSQKYSADGFENFGHFVQNRQEAYADVGSGAVLAAQPYIVKVMAFILGGVPWSNSQGLMGILAMLEGVVIFSALIYVLYLAFFKYGSKKIGVDAQFKSTIFMIIFIFCILLIMPVISSNLGLMVRLRVMMYPPLFVSLFLLLVVVRPKRSFGGI